MRTTNENGIALIKAFEGYKEKKYVCPAGYETIGYGHKLKEGEKYNKINQDKAEELLKCDLKEAEDAVSRFITTKVNDNQFSALVSFTYNLGSGTLQRSTLRQKINYGASEEEITDEFQKWTFSNGMKLSGLIKRRYYESLLFCSNS